MAVKIMQEVSPQLLAAVKAYRDAIREAEIKYILDVDGADVSLGDAINGCSSILVQALARHFFLGEQCGVADKEKFISVIQAGFEHALERQRLMHAETGSQH